MALADDMAVLASAPLLGLLPPEALRLVSFAADRRALRAGEILFRKGDDPDGGFVVLSGRVRVEGASAVTGGPGTLIGQTALFLREPRPASAVAETDAELLRLSPTLMRRVLQEFPDAAAAVRDALAAELSALVGGLDGVRARLDALDPPGSSDRPA